MPSWSPTLADGEKSGRMPLSNWIWMRSGFSSPGDSAMPSRPFRPVALSPSSPRVQVSPNRLVAETATASGMVTRMPSRLS